MARKQLHDKLKTEGKTAMLYEATAANYVTRDNMRELQATVIEQQEEIERLTNEVERLKESLVIAEDAAERARRLCQELASERVLLQTDLQTAWDALGWS